MFNKAILSLLLCLLVMSCNKKIAEVSSSPLAELNREIQDHGKIPVYDNRSLRVKRSGIDSLSAEQTKSINNHVHSFNQEYPDNKDFVFINYYPGKDGCNSTGMATRDGIGAGHRWFNQEIDRRSNTTQLSLYKDDDGLTRWNKNRNWQKDNDLVLTNMFFENHYGCSSSLILHKSGKFYFYYGESWNEKRISDLDLFIQAVNDGEI